LNVRERTEEIERLTLSPYATLSANSKGRAIEQEKCEIRTEFQRDRDKIIHSKAFRRLKHKTQVFITPEGDHYRTRLTHTLEVAQIARTIARALRLNEDLTEAMALGHDLGHTPFGHAGENALAEVCPFGFKHYEQSLRVVDLIENGSGLNLTFEVRDGILNHTGKMCAETLEGVVLKFADRIAYINHDIDDALRGGIISESQLPEACLKLLGDTHGKRINTLILDIIENSMDKPEIIMSEQIFLAMNMLRDFMFEHVYIGSAAKLEEGKAKYVVKRLYEYFVQNPDNIPHQTHNEGEGFEKERLAVDYIAGMTDRYAMYIYKKLFLPKAWYKH
jgi:dGTPase